MDLKTGSPETSVNAPLNWESLIGRFVQSLKEDLDYDPATGIFTWRIARSNRIKVGGRAGCINSQGYWVIRFRGELCRASRLAWYYHYSETPDYIDHINNIRSDDRIENLRSVTSRQNNMNKKTWNRLGVKGVARHGTKFVARITVNYEAIELGIFDSLEEAGEAFARAHADFFSGDYDE